MRKLWARINCSIYLGQLIVLKKYNIFLIPNKIPYEISKTQLRRNRK